MRVSQQFKIFQKGASLGLSLNSPVFPKNRCEDRLKTQSDTDQSYFRWRCTLIKGHNGECELFTGQQFSKVTSD